jgi:mono/diheme cytochrome c family protein
MTDAGVPGTVPDRPGYNEGLRWAFLVLTALFTAGIVVQVFLAGLGLLVNPDYYSWHTKFTHLLEVILLGMLLTAGFGRFGWGRIGMTVALFLLSGLQYAFINAQGSGRALHLVNALLIFWIGMQLLKSAWLALRRPAPGTRAAGPESRVDRLAPGLLVLLISAGTLALVGELVMVEPAGTNAVAADRPGTSLYVRDCASCHGSNGAGASGPALAEDPALADTSLVIGTILNGQGTMPAWRDRLTDEEIADVSSLIRNSWGNHFGTVTAAEVTALR